MPSCDGVQGAALLKNLLESTDLRHRGAEMFEQLLGDLAREALHFHEGLRRRLRKTLRACKALVNHPSHRRRPNPFHVSELVEQPRTFVFRDVELWDQ